jgi:hypothetical protein
MRAVRHDRSAQSLFSATQARKPNPVVLNREIDVTLAVVESDAHDAAAAVSDSVGDRLVPDAK